MFKKLLSLFTTFAKVGVMTFGGGLAMLPMLTREVVEHKKWATEEQLLDYYAVGQCTPGIIAVNTATFIGYNQAGVLGGIIATAGVVTPSVIIILAVAAVLQQFIDLPAVAGALMGIRAVVCALLTHTVINMGKKSIVDAVTAVIFLAGAALSFFLDVTPLLLVLLGAVTGIAANKIREAKKK